MKIKIIAGSTRPGRFNIQPAEWFFSIAKESKDATFELVDLEKINLPLLDEKNTPLEHKYEKDHTKRWSEIIDEADGFVIVTPEYNHSIPGALKNAIDYLYTEWNYKPVAYISYGSAAGGSRAVEHLRGVAAEQKMYDLREQILLSNYWENLDENGKYKFNDRHVDAAQKMIKSVVFWAQAMKEARAKIS
jgi:NAD(P)H-dependent FMN reductase